LQDLVLPFLLLFALIFAILQKIKVFTNPKRNEAGEIIANEKVPDRRLNGIIAAVLSLLIVVPHVMGIFPANVDPILLIGKFLPSSAILLVAMLLALLVIGISTEEAKIQPFGYLMTVIAAIIFGIILIITIFPSLPFAHYLYNPNIQALAIVLLTLGIVVWFVTRDKPEKPLHKRLPLWFGDDRFQ
jgi:hypothetical protein